MNARCKTCSKSKDENKMLRCKYASRDLNGKVFYGGFHYWYFCNDGCLSQFQEEQPVDIKRPETTSSRTKKVEKNS